jgi:hypothetical protein
MESKKEGYKVIVPPDPRRLDDAGFSFGHVMSVLPLLWASR